MLEIPTPQQQATLTADQVSKILNIGRNQVYNAMKNGEIPCLRLGRRLVIPTAAFRNLLGLDAQQTTQ